MTWSHNPRDLALRSYQLGWDGDLRNEAIFGRGCRSHARMSTLVALEGRQFLSAANMKTAPSFAWLAAIQGIERKQDLARLAPKGRFISAKAIKGEVRQIGETQKATRELGGGTNNRSAGSRRGGGQGFIPAGNAALEADPLGLFQQRIDNFLGGRTGLAGLLELVQLVRLDFEQAGFHRGGAAQPPQQTG